MSKQFKGSLSIILATIIWGSTFVAQSVGVEKIGPITFLAIRGYLAVLALLPVVYVRHRGHFFSVLKDPKLWKAGVLCGAALFVATALQQVGLIYTSAAKGGFITAMYIILVPVFGLFLKKKPPKTTVFSVAIAAIGLYFISGIGVSSINIGDVLMLLCAVGFSVQILLLDHLATDLDSIALNLVQSLVCALISTVFMFTEAPSVADMVSCWLPLMYAGVLSMGVAYTLQIVGQKCLEPTTASLLMSFESVFAALSGWLILNETLTATEFLGCGLVFAAIMLSQISAKTKPPVKPEA